MKVVYYDGSILHCHSLYFAGTELIADDVYIIPIAEILRIESE